MLKYPLLLIALNPGLWDFNGLSAGVWLLLIQVFLAASAYEVMHDAEHFSSAINKVIMPVEYHLLIVSLIWRSLQISAFLLKGIALSANVIGLVIGCFMLSKLNNYAYFGKIKYTPFVLLFMEGALCLLNMRIQSMR